MSRKPPAPAKPSITSKKPKAETVTVEKARLPGIPAVDSDSDVEEEVKDTSSINFFSLGKTGGENTVAKESSRLLPTGSVQLPAVSSVNPDVPNRPASTSDAEVGMEDAAEMEPEVETAESVDSMGALADAPLQFKTTAAPYGPARGSGPGVGYHSDHSGAALYGNQAYNLADTEVLYPLH